jgi:ribosomal protein S18 acetylase RimI-like enzyme
MSLSIREVPAADAPMHLLLIADPSEQKIRSYLPCSRCFVASCEEEVIGACVVQPLAAGAYELMNIAVLPTQQKSGCGTALLKWVIGYFGEQGAAEMEVGTGTFGYQLAFYQRLGFRVTRIDRDFFVRNYAEPVYEDGIRHVDMLRLTLRYPALSA